MRRNSFLKLSCQIFIFWVALLCLSCQSTKNSDTGYDKSDSISEYSFNKAGSNGCISIMNDYCAKLYSPGSYGNLMIERRNPIQIQQGESYNQLPQVFIKYSVAKLRSRNTLPADFVRVLNKYSYFDKLQEYLNRKPIHQMNLSDRINTENLSDTLSTIWQSSLDETVLTRMSAKYPAFYKIPPRFMPIEYDVEERRVRRKLISNISKVLWRDDKNWQRVIEGFNELKASFFVLFDKLDIPESIRADWKSKITQIELVLPGSLPEISDEECSTTTINAYYYRNLNLITVCAGDFNSEDIILTLAHEMSHSLDVDRDLYLYSMKSEIGLQLFSLRKNVCTAKPNLNCDDWSNLKNNILQKKLSLAKFQPQLPEFQKCLKRSPTSKSIDNDSANRISEKIVRDRIANMASSDLFLRTVKEKLPLRSGGLQKNPNFMDPCAYYLWSKNEEPIDDDLFTLIFFTAEYTCARLNPQERLKSSIQMAQKLSQTLIAEMILSESELSDRPDLVSEGYASSPVERFADVLGTYAVSEYLKKFDTTWDRRTKFLASSSWLCQEPSLSTVFPTESAAEKLFTSNSHTEGEDRKREILSGPIRQALRCEKDFTFNECSLPFKKNSDSITKSPLASK